MLCFQDVVVLNTTRLHPCTQCVVEELYYRAALCLGTRLSMRSFAIALPGLAIAYVGLCFRHHRCHTALFSCDPLALGVRLSRVGEEIKIRTGLAKGDARL